MQIKDTSKFRFGPKYFGPPSGRERCYPPVVVGEVVIRFQGEPPIAIDVDDINEVYRL